MVDLDGFGPATQPPMTEAKRELIELGMDSSESFFVEWTAKAIPLPVVACRAEDLFEGYRHYCQRQGVHKAASMKTFVGAVSKRPGVRREKRQHFKNYSRFELTQSSVILPPGARQPADRQELSDDINSFNQALRDWKAEAMQGSSRGSKGDGQPAGGGDDGPF